MDLIISQNVGTLKNIILIRHYNRDQRDRIQKRHSPLASLGYASQPLSCTWITDIITLTLYQLASMNKR